MELFKTSHIRKYLILFFVFCSLLLHSKESNLIEGYWLTSASIVQIKKCKDEICATIEHIFVEEGVDPKSVLDSNNKKNNLKNRPLIGVNLLDGFKYIESSKNILKNGRIYDPGRGRVFKSNLYILENGNLKVEGCFMGFCGHEEWQPLKVIINDDGTRSLVM